MNSVSALVSPKRTTAGLRPAKDERRKESGDESHALQGESSRSWQNRRERRDRGELVCPNENPVEIRPGDWLSFGGVEGHSAKPQAPKGENQVPRTATSPCHFATPSISLDRGPCATHDPKGWGELRRGTAAQVAADTVLRAASLAVSRRTPTKGVARTSSPLLQSAAQVLKSLGTRRRIRRSHWNVTVHEAARRGTGPCFRTTSLSPNCVRWPKNGPVPSRPVNG